MNAKGVVFLYVRKECGEQSLQLDSGWGLGVDFTFQPPFARSKRLKYPLSTVLQGNLNLCGRCVQEKHSTMKIKMDANTTTTTTTTTTEVHRRTCQKAQRGSRGIVLLFL